jgi:nitrogen regulatory protein PII
MRNWQRQRVNWQVNGAATARHNPEEVNMRFKMIIVLVEDDKTEEVLEAARDAGATGSTVIKNARGEGLRKIPTFLGLTLETQRDVLLLLVEEHLSRHILEEIGRVGEFDETPGTGIAFQVDVQDAIGVKHQIEELSHKVEDEL